MNSSLPHSASPQKLDPNLLNIIQQLRQEIHLLAAELKGRDKLLSDMVAKHETQLQAWRCNRQKVLTCTEQRNLLKDELNERDQMIKSLTKRLKEMSEKVRDATAHCQALEEKNQNLHCLVLELSAKKGQLQGREQELLTMLELKDEAILEAADHITEFTSKFKKLGSALHAAETEKLDLSKDKQDLELSLKKLIFARDDLYEKMKENNKQQEELIHLTQENGYLRRELALRVGKANTKDQFLQVAKSKQAWTDTELSSLQQIYMKQQRGFQFHHVNLESSQELRQKHEKAAPERSLAKAFSAPESNSETDAVSAERTHEICKECGTAQAPRRRLKSTSEMCEVDHRLLLNASYPEETTSVNLNPKVVKVLAVPREEEEKQDVASSSDELDSKVFCEANNARSLGNREVSENGVESRDQQTFESSLSECEHWLNAQSRVDSPSPVTQNAVTPDKSENAHKVWEEGTGILSCPESREAPAAIHKCESDCCSNDFSVKKDTLWKPVSDLEWLKVFKHTDGYGSIWHGSCLKTAQEMKWANSKSEENGDLNPFHLESPCLISTQKGGSPLRCEKSSDENFPLEISHLSVAMPTNRCCSAAMEQDTSSPTSKLQHVLHKSRQMVAELSPLLQATPCCTPNSSNFSRDSLWLLRVMTGFDFCMWLNRWKEEVILEQAVGGLGKKQQNLQKLFTEPSYLQQKKEIHSFLYDILG